MSHRYHPDPDRDDPPAALLWDDCERCDEQAKDALGLDRVKLREAWDRMIAVETSGPGRPRNVRYLTTNERRLGRFLYIVYVINERLAR